MKKFLAITLALVMTFAMVACGGTSSSTPASTPASGTGAAEPAAEGGEIVIGCLQDITGATSALGMSVQAGAQAAVDEINAAGGIGGKTVVMKTYDTKGDVTEAVNVYITAVTVDNVSLIVPRSPTSPMPSRRPLRIMTSPLWALHLTPTAS